jgi:hypothetical protein
MEYLVVATIIGLGFYLRTDSNKKLNKKFIANVPKNQIPSSDNVYTSRRSYNIYENEQKKANVLQSKSLYPQDTNVVTPGPTFPIVYNKVDYQENNLPIEFNQFQNYDNILIDDTIEKKVDIDLSKNNKSVPDSGGWSGISLTGDQINPNTFTHNNMTPFFGSGVRQNMDEFSTRGIFENFTGTQDNYQKKQEQGLLFEPQKNMGNVYGTGSLDGFMLDRYYVSNIRSNETPIEKVYVGPGLNQGYTNEPSGGFQQPDALEYATPKTTDEIRVKTNPKISYYGRVVSGEKINKPGKIGTVYKNRPDTFYVQDADRYLTTTGQVIAPEQRPCIVTKYTNRKTTELKTRTGSAAPTNGTVAQVRSKYKISRKITYQEDNFRNVDGTGTWSILNMLGFKNVPNDYGKQSIKIRNNKRVLNNSENAQGVVMNYKSNVEKGVARNKQKLKHTRKIELIDNNRQSGNYQGAQKSKVYNPNDLPKTTIKESNIHNNHSGMISSQAPSKGAVYDPDEIARTTVKETNIHNNHSGMMSSQMPGKGVAYDPNDITRTTIKETNIHNNHSGMMSSQMPGKGVAYDPNDITRTTIKETNIHNNHSGMMSSQMPGKGVAYDPNDITRTTIKETNIHNKHSGNMSSQMPGKGIAYDPNDITRTTIKETNIHNKRSGNIQNKNRGNVVYDPNDVARTTIKETNIHNSHNGMLSRNAPSSGVVYDPNNKPKTTLKETTVKNNRKANISNNGSGNKTYVKNIDKPKVTTKQTTIVKNAMGIASRTNDNGYLVTDVQAPDTIREHSSVEYMGDATGPELGAYDVTEVNAPNTMRQFTSDVEYFGGAGNDGVNTAPMSYEDIYNAEIKAIRGTIDEGYTPGPMIPNQGVSSENINVTTSKIGDIQNKYLNERGVQANKVYNSIPQMTHINMTQDKEIVPNEPLADRINPAIVSAFKDNPYTQPLDSWA